MGDESIETTFFKHNSRPVYVTCSRCDYSTYKEIPAAGHSYTANVTAPTCTEKGYTTYICACGDTYVDDYVDALGHDIITDAAVPATCTETGLTEGCHCSRCDYKVAQNTVAALGHDEIHHEGKAATCTEKGWEAYVTCSRCDYTTYKEIPATGHSYTATVTAPTCTEKGYTTYTCACGDTYVDDYVDAPGHDYAGGVCAKCGEEDPDYVAPSKTFTDVPEGAWYVGAVDYVVENGLMNGMGKNEFRPEEAMTRAMLVTVLWRYAGSPVEGTNGFNDLTQDWYIQAVAWASSNGIVNGYPDGTFKPDEKVTREQLATIIYRYCNTVDIDTSARADLTVFPDAKNVNSYASDAISWAVSAGLISGITHGGNATVYLEPQTSATRAQVATILMRFLQNVAK